jgi:hypothetical protein
MPVRMDCQHSPDWNRPVGQEVMTPVPVGCHEASVGAIIAPVPWVEAIVVLVQALLVVAAVDVEETDGLEIVRSKLLIGVRW